MPIPPKIEATPEQQFVLAVLARPGSSADTTDTLSWDQINWDKFLTETTSNLFPVLHFECQRRGLDQRIPARVWARLEAGRHATRLRHLRWQSAIKAITGALASFDVPCLLLKGADLKYRLYSEPSARPMADLDLLIPPTKFEAATKALHTQGYRPRFAPHEETPISSRPAPWEEVIFFKQVGTEKLMVELKSRPESTPLDLTVEWEELWERSEPSVLPLPANVRVLHPHDLIAQLSLHLVYHHSCERGLLWLLDIRLAIEHWHGEIDWLALKRVWAEDGSQQSVNLALYLAREWLGAPTPDEVLIPLPAPDLGALTQLAWQQMFSAQIPRQPPPSITRIFATGNARLIGHYCVERLRLWGSRDWSEKSGVHIQWWSVPGLMLKRAWRDLKTYRAAWREGGMSPGVIRQALNIQQRSEHLKRLLEPADK